MTSQVRIFAIVATHLSAFALGWLVWTNVSPSPAKDEQVTGDVMYSATSERRRLREEEGPGGEKVLKRLFGDGKFELPSQNENWGKSRRDHYAGLLAKSAELAPASDRAAAAMEAIGEFAKTVAADDKFGDSAEMTSRMIHWMQTDPDAATGYLGSLTDPRVRKHVSYFLGQAAMAITTETGLVEAAKWFRGDSRDSSFNAQLRPQIARELGANADLNEIAAFQQQMKGKTAIWTDIRNTITTSWPIEKADDLVVLSQSEKSPGMLTTFAMSHGGEGAAWFENLLVSGALPPEVHESIVTNKEYGRFMLKSPTIDLEKRLEVMASFNPDRSQESLLSEITHSDIGNVMSKGKDYRFAFRNGTMSAEEVYAEVASQLPMLASKSPESIRAYLFSDLAEEDGPKAMSLIDNLAPEEKWRTAMKPVTGMFHGVNPQQFYDYLQHVPLDATPQSIDERVKAWTKLGRENHARLGDSYLAWVRALPEGPDKDMAALSIVETSNLKNQKLADEFAATIKDDRIRQRIPWKP